MGPVRGGLILSILPGAALAEICSVQRPNWNGVPVTMVQEAILLASSPVALVLFLGSALAIRFRNQWAALVTVVCWTLFVSFLSMFAPSARTAGMAEGCIGSPALFIGIIAAICVGMILYTAPQKAR